MNTPRRSAGPPAFKNKTARQPLLCAAVAYSFGIIAGVYLWRPELWWVVAGFAFVAAASFFITRRTWLAGPLALGALFFAGAMHVQMRDGPRHLDSAVLPLADGQELTVVAHVTRSGRLHPGNFGEMRQVVDVESETVATEDGIAVPIRSGIRLSIYSPRSTGAFSEETNSAVNPSQWVARIFRYGERLRFSGKLRRPRNFRNPGAFDYEGYLAENAIAALGSSKAENVELLSGFSGSRNKARLSRIRENVLGRVGELWQPREAALIDAMVVGEEAFIDRDTRVDFQRSGTYHVLIVSGMNVSILAFVVFWTLRRIRLGEISATLGTLGFCVAYAFLTEVGAPVWRATLMCAIYLATRLLYRDRAMVNALGAAELGLLMFDPRQLFTASFQMTFICVLIVAAIGRPTLERTSQLYKQALAHWDSDNYGETLPPLVAQFRVDLRFIASRLATFLGEKTSLVLVRFAAKFSFRVCELLFISAIMQMGLALPMAFYFHRATTLGLPANLAVVPLTGIMMPAAVMSIALGYISPLLAKIPALITSATLQAIAGTVHGLGGLR